MKVNPNKGIFLGKVMWRAYYIDTKENILVYAPKRTGGHSGITIPNLLITHRNIVVEDRSCTYTNTSKYRKEVLGQEIIQIKVGDEIPELPNENYTIYVMANSNQSSEDVIKTFNKISEKLKSKEFLAIGRQEVLECFTEPSIQKIAFIENPPLIKPKLFIDWGEDRKHYLFFNEGEKKKIRKCFFFKEDPFFKRDGSKSF